MIAVVRATADLRDRSFLATTLGSLAGAIVLAHDFPDFSSQHAFALSSSICLGLAAIRLAQRRLLAPALICDGHWLAYRSWLLGALIDLEGLEQVECLGAGADGPPGEIRLRARQRELYRLELRRWRREDVQGLLAALVENRPQVQLDRATRRWLEQPRAA
ncbi:MAG TPA: hypothetical protein VFA75_23250 [Nevskia sp.]|nr:hypothetical protein [Nevskia sp.]